MTELMQQAKRALGWVRASRPVRAVRDALRWQEFRVAENRNLFWGVFPTFADAERFAPATKPLGYDNPDSAAMYRSLLTRVEPNEYAVLHWLRAAVRPGSTVFDFGGHVGVKYYALRTLEGLPPDLRWMVYDVPAVLEAGRRLATRRGATELTFTERFEDASGVDAFLALGALQYVEIPLAARLAQLEALPRTVIISSTPMVEGPRYVTLQNIGTAFCPYLIEDARAFIAAMEGLGYVLLQRWTNPEKHCDILDQPAKSVDGYTAMTFELRPGSRAR